MQDTEPNENERFSEMNDADRPSNFNERDFPFVQPSSFPQPQPAQPLEAPVTGFQPIPAPVPVPPITHAPAVAVGHYSDGLGVLWTGLILNLAGLYPLIVFLASLSNPRHMTTVGAWLLISPLLFIGTLLCGSGIKEKGYQNESIRIFATVSFFVGILLFFTPVVASILYGFGIGN
jgi:hypothetical protein